MMVGIFAGTVMTTFDIESIEELTHIPHGWDIVQAPNYVSAGWQYKNGTFTAPFQEGFTFDINDRRYYSNEEYRRILHSRTTDDTLQALRKIRENDKTIDWQSWLNTLDQYNLDIESTKNQNQNEIIIWPEYPKKPTQ